MTSDSPGRAMTASCLINNYNYVRFVGEAIRSALKQTVPFEEIIVVDDGWTDGSAKFLANAYGGHVGVRIVTKRNEGQICCFNEGFARTRAHIVFFLLSHGRTDRRVPVAARIDRGNCAQQ
jgi:glycosyltransferase involved in cell wall biosynthesis